MTEMRGKKKGQFFTQRKLCYQMIEMFSDDIKKDFGNQGILDPTAGSGNLIVACIEKGANPKRCYANELDPVIYEILKDRLTKLGVPEKNITNFDVLSKEFSDWYSPKEKKKFTLNRKR